MSDHVERLIQSANEDPETGLCVGDVIYPPHLSETITVLSLPGADGWMKVKW